MCLDLIQNLSSKMLKLQYSFWIHDTTFALFSHPTIDIHFKFILQYKFPFVIFTTGSFLKRWKWYCILILKQAHLHTKTQNFTTIYFLLFLQYQIICYTITKDIHNLLENRLWNDLIISNSKNIINKGNRNELCYIEMDRANAFILLS